MSKITIVFDVEGIKSVLSNSYCIFIMVYPELFGRRAVTSAKHESPPFVQINQDTP